MTSVASTWLMAGCGMLWLGTRWVASVHSGMLRYNSIREALLIRPVSAVGEYCQRQRDEPADTKQVCTVRLNWRNSKGAWYHVCRQDLSRPLYTRRYYRITLLCAVGSRWQLNHSDVMLR